MSNVPVQQAVINQDAPAESLERKQPYIDNGVAVLDKVRYYSREFMQAEAQFKKALELQPNNDQIKRNLQNLRERMRKN